MSNFKTGDEIKAIFFPDDSVLEADKNTKIKVILENGQMAHVPWFGVYKKGKLVWKYNAAHCIGVRL